MANILIRQRVAVLILWIAGAASLAGLSGAPPLRQAASTELLPPSAASRQATGALGAHFPVSAALSQVVVIVERPDDPSSTAVETLRKGDLAAMDRIRRRVLDSQGSPYAERFDVSELSVLSPSNKSVLRPAMVSKARAGLGQAALMTVQIPAGRIDTWSADVADHVQYAAIQTRLPVGLNVEVTGTATFTRDYLAAADRSQRRTLPVAIGAVVLILLLTYRAPLTAGIALVTVALAAGAAGGVLAVAEAAGEGVGAVERIMLYVLLFGATVNYSLFYLAGFREGLGLGRDPLRAAADSWRSTAPVITASAATTIAGFATLALARYGVFRTMGPTAAVALGIALAAALTLVPAVAALGGAALFWPARPRRPYGQHSRMWPVIGAWVSRWPAAAALLAVVLLAAPTLGLGRLRWSYDSLGDLEPTYPAMRGAALIRRHWIEGELAPVGVLIESGRNVKTSAFEKLSGRLTRKLYAIEGVADVRSVSAPIGARVDPRFAQRDPSLLGQLGGLLDRMGAEVAGLAAGGAARESYLRRRAMRMEVILSVPPFSDQAAAVVGRVRPVIERAVNDSALAGSDVFLSGLTAEMIDVRAVTEKDFRRVAVAAMIVIGLIAVVLIRDVLLAAIMVVGTVAAYLAALGLTAWVFDLRGGAGVDWKVQLFLFIVMAAIGQDYNIYLVARLGAEARRHTRRAAARRAIAATGGIITTCGLIMAATLAALTASDVGVLVQVGFAFAAGILIDTFVVRPLLVPALAVLTGRMGRPIA